MGRPLSRRTRVWLACRLASVVLAAPCAAWAQSPPAPLAPLAPAQAASAPSVVNSNMDAALFYQLLIGELELRGGENGSAFAVILDAARRTKDEALFRRAVDVALASRAGEQALAASRNWRSALPESADAARTQLQLLIALGRVSDTAEPARAMIANTSVMDRPGLIAALPRFYPRQSDTKAVAQLIEDITRGYADAPATRTAARVAQGRAWLNAGDADRALTLATEAHAADRASAAPALLALDLMRQRAEPAERIVKQTLAQPGAEPGLRLGYARQLTESQRYAEAIEQIEALTHAQPTLAQPYLSLGALHLDLRNFAEAEKALKHYVELTQAAAGGAAAAPGAASAPHDADDGDDDTDSAAGRPDRGLVQAWLMLSQAAEQRGDFAGAERWLAQIDDPQRALEVQSRRASILARQGKVREAQQLIRQVPERSAEDGRAKLTAELGVLRDVKRWQEAHQLLADALKQQPDDTDLLYEQAMLAEKLDRLPEMEKLLRRVIELKPDNAHAHNALGYSLADRRQRLPEARQLVQRALELAPGDPFISDSLGWVEFRMGNREEALRILKAAYAARPDAEIGTHLGEVMWAMGQKDEARRVWRAARGRDATNEVLRETLARLRVDL